MPRVMNKLKPWLITPSFIIDQEKEVRNRIILDYLHRYRYPGNTCSALRKVEWVEHIDRENFETMMHASYESIAPDGNEVAKEILYRMAPQNIQLDVVVDQREFEEHSKILDDEEKMKFVNAFAKRNSRDSPDMNECTTFDACKDWLNAHARISSKRSDQLLLLTSINCTKDFEWDDLRFWDIIHQFSLGVTTLLPGAEQWGGIQEKLGECMFYGMEYMNTDMGNIIAKENNRSSTRIQPVHYCVQLVMEKRSKPEKEFQTMLRNTMLLSHQSSDPKAYILLNQKYAPRAPQDGNGKLPKTAEYFHPFWLPQSFNDHFTRIYEHLEFGKGESNNIQKRIRRGTTDSGNIKVTLFEYELQYVRHIESLKEQFAAVLALANAAHRDDDWMIDNECGREVDRLMKSLAALFRTRLLIEDDEALGIGLAENSTEKEDQCEGLSKSRRLLYELLDVYEEAFTIHDSVSTFNWRPKKRKSSDKDGSRGGKKKR